MSICRPELGPARIEYRFVFPTAVIIGDFFNTVMTLAIPFSSSDGTTALRIEGLLESLISRIYYGEIWQRVTPATLEGTIDDIASEVASEWIHGYVVEMNQEFETDPLTTDHLLSMAYNLTSDLMRIILRTNILETVEEDLYDDPSIFLTVGLTPINNLIVDFVRTYTIPNLPPERF